MKRIGLTYLSRGLVDKVTQYDHATVGSGSVLNEVGYEYDDWGNIAKSLQDRDGAITTAGGHNEAQVAFAYSAVTTADGTGRARVQRSSMTNPKTLGTSDGATVAYTFGTGGSIAEVFGRVSKVSVGGTDVASYEYQGAGTLVTTAIKTATADTVYRMHSGSSGSGFSGCMDNFGRVTRSQWKKLLGTPVTLYDLTLTYDRDGNITSADDAATGGSGAGWDVKYGMDSLNRLTDADEGTLSTGSITSRTRRERWDQNTSGLGLDQVGNWSRRKLDLNGDGDYVDAGETDDSGTFNVANEWLTRDVDSNSSANYTLAHDAVGNMTDDGKDYTFVYDVFGRLVKVKARSGGATVAEYGYDGLGQRIFYHADEDADGTVESSNDDPRYNFVYDDKWRIVATYRVPYSGSDTTPKETYVWHSAGMDGHGGSSYIDSVILRDRDNTNGWTGAPDGTLEERRFYLQNWRADVSAVCNTNGRPLERIKYSAYGVPITLTELDFNLDGNIDPDDPSDFIGAPYDWDLDADTDAADSTAFAADYGLVSGNSYGRAVLSMSGIGNRLGYAGYVGDRFIRGSGSSTTQGGQGFKWHVRHRVLDSGLGRWTRRDPLGYVDGVLLYRLNWGDPLHYVDALGLCAVCMQPGAPPPPPPIVIPAPPVEPVPAPSMPGKPMQLPSLPPPSPVSPRPPTTPLLPPPPAAPGEMVPVRQPGGVLRTCWTVCTGLLDTAWRCCGTVGTGAICVLTMASTCQAPAPPVQPVPPPGPFSPDHPSNPFEPEHPRFCDPHNQALFQQWKLMHCDVCSCLLYGIGDQRACDCMDHKRECLRAYTLERLYHYGDEFRPACPGAAPLDGHAERIRRAQLEFEDCRLKCPRSIVTW